MYSGSAYMVSNLLTRIAWSYSWENNNTREGGHVLPNALPIPLLLDNLQLLAV